MATKGLTYVHGHFENVVKMKCHSLNNSINWFFVFDERSSWQEMLIALLVLRVSKTVNGFKFYPEHHLGYVYCHNHVILVNKLKLRQTTLVLSG